MTTEADLFKRLPNVSNFLTREADLSERVPNAPNFLTREADLLERVPNAPNFSTGISHLIDYLQTTQHELSPENINVRTEPVAIQLWTVSTKIPPLILFFF